MLVGPDGCPIKNKEGLHPFSGTYFDAGLDASEGKTWTQRYDDYEIQEWVFITQSRRLKSISFLLGIQPDLNERERETLSQILGVPGQVIVDNANRIKGQSGCLILGQAIRDILDAIPQCSSLFENLAIAGSMVSLWSPPTLFNEKEKKLRFPSFRFTGTKDPPG